VVERVVRTQRESSRSWDRSPQCPHVSANFSANLFVSEHWCQYPAGVKIVKQAFSLEKEGHASHSFQFWRCFFLEIGTLYSRKKAPSKFERITTVAWPCFSREEACFTIFQLDMSLQRWFVFFVELLCWYFNTENMMYCIRTDAA
jgi:hypothetical protein